MEPKFAKECTNTYSIYSWMPKGGRKMFKKTDKVVFLCRQVY